jgi:hypothetical protein
MAKTAIWDNLQARAHIEALDPFNECAFYNIVDSLEAIALPMLVKGGERKKIVWNLYIDPPSENPDLHNEWSSIITDTSFTTALYGIAKPRCRTADAVANIIKLKPHGTLAVKQVT